MGYRYEKVIHRWGDPKKDHKYLSDLYVRYILVAIKVGTYKPHIREFLGVPDKDEECSCCASLCASLKGSFNTGTGKDGVVILKHCLSEAHLRCLYKEHPQSFINRVPRIVQRMIWNLELAPLYINHKDEAIRKFAALRLQTG